MWIKYLITIILFYLFAVLQNSFFAHFNLFGAAPNLVFALFFVLIFFINKNDYYQIAFIAIAAGLFLDVFSYMRFGVSIISLLIIGFLFKKIQSLLQEKKGNDFPFVYFLPLFFVSLMVYDLILRHIDFNISFLAEIIYNLIFVSIIFYVYKKFLQSKIDNRQLKLFGG